MREGLICPSFPGSVSTTLMEWSTKQQGALDSVAGWLENKQSPVFRLFGYAGSGKTTLARHFAKMVRGRVMFGAFTGKAALVLREKGCADASTIHRLIYLPKSKSEERLHDLKAELAIEKDTDRQRILRIEIRQEEANLKRPSFTLNLDSEIRSAALVVIDEVSMVGEQIGMDLVGFDTPLLVLGDTAQLPPVADGGFFTNEEPDVLLDEIHRQAAGSPVIQMATEVRTVGKLSRWQYDSDQGQPSSFVVAKSTLNLKDLLEFEQILVGRNATRKKVNRIMRDLHGRKSHLPEEGDRLVCLRNNHDEGLLNGSLWDVLDCVEVSEDLIGLTLHDPTWGGSIETLAHRHHFEDREEDLSHWEVREANQFDYGYALTVHKAQGSQWESVCVLDESSCFREHARRWLYTGITRASEKVVVLR